MHQLAQRRIVFALRIDIYDVGAVAERLSGLLNHAVNVVDGKSCLQDIPFCNENNVGFPSKRLLLYLARRASAPSSRRWISML